MKKLKSVLCTIFALVLCSITFVACSPKNPENPQQPEEPQTPTTITITLAEAETAIINALAIDEQPQAQVMTTLLASESTHNENRDLLEKFGKFKIDYTTTYFDYGIVETIESGNITYTQNGDYVTKTTYGEYIYNDGAIQQYLINSTRARQKTGKITQISETYSCDMQYDYINKTEYLYAQKEGNYRTDPYDESLGAFILHTIKKQEIEQGYKEYLMGMAEHLYINGVTKPTNVYVAGESIGVDEILYLFSNEAFEYSYEDEVTKTNTADGYQLELELTTKGAVRLRTIVGMNETEFEEYWNNGDYVAPLFKYSSSNINYTYIFDYSYQTLEPYLNSSLILNFDSQGNLTLATLNLGENISTITIEPMLDSEIEIPQWVVDYKSKYE